MRSLWNKLFLEERPSIVLSFFRIAVALTIGFHVLPSFCQLEDNYFKTAFSTLNANFFPVSILEFVQKSPDMLVVAFVWIFCIAWLFFLVGFKSQLSAIVLLLSSYYFYALNSFHIGTLSWDILLVTLFLMCVTPYHGDYFSLDCLLKGDENAYKRRRPFFIQRLLQMQIAFTYFYTALYKVTAKGNWLTDNPIYYLMNSPTSGVMKTFILKDFLMYHPEICRVLGLLIIAVEFSMPFLLFYRKTRVSAIYLGFIFHITLLLTMDVPAIFFFLFPAQLLLFIHPDIVVNWIERKRAHNAAAPQPQLIYDGHCQFCLRSVNVLKIMDLFGVVKYVDLYTMDLTVGTLSKEKAMSQLHLVEPGGKVFGGFDVFRRICFSMPMLYPFILVLYFPGMGLLGPMIYRFIAKNRYLFHFNKVCQNNACFVHSSPKK